MLLLKVWKDQPGKFFCISSKSRKGEWKDNFFRRGQLSEIKAYIEDNLDKDLYWCPHGFDKPRRTKDSAEPPKILWADLDEVDPRDLGELMPTYAWESSPGRFACVWKVDGYVNDELNRRLTYHIEADHGGWDYTQVLRIPGTKNYKYASCPKVKTLWVDGPEHQLSKIEKLLPKVKAEAKKDDSATKIYKKYESKLSPFARRELLRGKPQKGRRSEVIWKLNHELIEAGMSRDEAFEVLRVSPWNKFKGRRDGDDQLKRELDKALDKHLHLIEDDSDETFEEEDVEEDEEEHVFLSKSMAEVEEENIDWLWYPYLARGELTILEGDPGLGKSYLAPLTLW